MIEFYNVSVNLGRRQVLNSISLEIKKGDFYYLIGKTGAGKTTLLRLIYMDLMPDSGNLVVDRFNSARIRRHQIPLLRRKVGVIFQDFKLLPDRTVFENVAFALQVIGARSYDIKNKVPAALTRVGLYHKRYRMPHHLSGGEQQRVAIARAFVNRPLLLIADEPTGNLDPETSREIMDLLDRINRTGTTVLMATHDHHIVDSMRQRVVELSLGKLVRDEQRGVYGMNR